MTDNSDGVTRCLCLFVMDLTFFFSFDPAELGSDVAKPLISWNRPFKAILFFFSIFSITFFSNSLLLRILSLPFLRFFVVDLTFSSSISWVCSGKDLIERIEYCFTHLFKKRKTLPYLTISLQLASSWLFPSCLTRSVSKSTCLPAPACNRFFYRFSPQSPNKTSRNNLKKDSKNSKSHAFFEISPHIPSPLSLRPPSYLIPLTYFSCLIAVLALPFSLLFFLSLRRPTKASSCNPHRRNIKKWVIFATVSRE